MKCPYILTTIETHHPMPIRYHRLDITNQDETPDVLHLTNNDTIYTIVNQPTECLQIDCGAWQDGKCQRRG